MSKILVFTDLHIVPEGQTIIGIDPSARLAAGLAHAARLHPDADLMVITGDLTHYGDAASYRRLKAHLDGFPVPVLMTIGNHDDRQVFRSVFNEAIDDGNGFVATVHDLDDARIVLLDTKADEAGAHDGLLCPARIAWLDDKIASAGGKPVLIFMHHPPHATGFAGMDAIRLRNEEAFWSVVGAYPQVRHIFAGHVHRTISGSHRGVPFSIFKSPAHQQPMPFAETDTSNSVDEPGAYGIVLVTAHGLLVHSDDFGLDAAPATYRPASA